MSGALSLRGGAVHGAVRLWLRTLVGSGTGLAPALIWAAHIGFDRALGYGLKYPTAFSDTHLGRIGPGAHPRESTTDMDGAPFERRDSGLRC